MVSLDQIHDKMDNFATWCEQNNGEITTFHANENRTFSATCKVHDRLYDGDEYSIHFHGPDPINQNLSAVIEVEDNNSQTFRSGIETMDDIEFGTHRMNVEFPSGKARPDKMI